MIVYINRVWNLIEAVGIFTCTWPETNMSKRRFIFRNIYWTFTFINTLLSVGSLILGIHYNDNGVITVIEAATELGCIAELIFDLILYKKYSARLQMLVQKVKSYVRNASEYETNVIQGYIERYKKQFLVIVFQYISAGILFNIAPICTSKNLPFHSWFPLPMRRKEIHYYIFFMESYTIAQIVTSIFIDFLIVGLVIYTAARLDILGSEMKQVSDYDMLTKCVKEHQEIIGLDTWVSHTAAIMKSFLPTLIRHIHKFCSQIVNIPNFFRRDTIFFEDTTTTVRTLLFKTIIAMGGAVISAVLCLLYARNESFIKAWMYFGTVCAGCGHIFIITWPADDLRESSIKFARSLYDVPWIGKSPKISSAVLIMMQRCQKPFLITTGGFFPVLSLQLFSQFLSNVFSYFMAMRSVLE